jgi:hypothetical protein
MNFLLVEIALLTIVVLSAAIAREFYKSTRTNGLRAVMVALFVCKIWVYGGSAIWFIIHEPDNSVLWRVLILNAPMFIVMLMLWKYVRTHYR